MLLLAIAPVLELETMEDVSFEEMMVSRDMAQSIRSEDSMMGKVKAGKDGKPVLYATNMNVEDGKIVLSSVYSSSEGTTVVSVDVELKKDYDSPEDVINALMNGEQIDVDSGSLVITNDSGDTIEIDFDSSEAKVIVNGEDYDNVDVQGDVDVNQFLENGSASLTLNIDGEEVPVSLSLVDPDTGEPVSIDPSDSSLDSLPAVQVTIEGGNDVLSGDVVTYLDLSQLLGL